MFERIEISEYIYEGILEPYYKKTTRVDVNCAGLSRKMRGDVASSTTYSKKNESSYKHRKRYVHHNKDRSQLSCLIHGPGNSSDECKVLIFFVSKKTKSRLNKERSQELTLKKIKGLIKL